MGAMYYFGQLVLEIFENNYLKSYFRLSEWEILYPFLETS